MKQIFFTPQRGDVVRVASSIPPYPQPPEFRYFLVLSPQVYNSRVGLALLCPISPDIRGYPFEVPIPPDLPVRGAVLADQAESFDWRSRRAEPICVLPPRAVEEVIGKLRALLG